MKPSAEAAPSAAAEPAAEQPCAEPDQQVPQPLSELRWLRLPTEARAGIAFADAGEFWLRLQSCFAKCGTAEVQAAQLLACGAPMNESNRRKLRALERLELVGLKGNSIQLKQRA